MNREIDKTLSADWIKSEANVWKGIFMKSDMGIGLVKGGFFAGGRDCLVARVVSARYKLNCGSRPGPVCQD